MMYDVNFGTLCYGNTCALPDKLQKKLPAFLTQYSSRVRLYAIDGLRGWQLDAHAFGEVTCKRSKQVR